jgi:hypothetical protein
MPDDARLRGELPPPKPLPDRPFGGLVNVLDTLETYWQNFRVGFPHRATGDPARWYDLAKHLHTRIRLTPGFDRLTALCRAETGKEPDAEYVRRLTGRLSRDTGRPLAEIESLSIPEAMDLLVSKSPPEGAKPPTTTKPQGITAQDRRLSVKAMIDALAASKLWGVEPKEIAKRSRINEKTLYRYLKHDAVKKTWDRYCADSAGKPPANLDDLGDEPMFSFRTRD